MTLCCVHRIVGVPADGHLCSGQVARFLVSRCPQHSGEKAMSSDSAVFVFISTYTTIWVVAPAQSAVMNETSRLKVGASSRPAPS